MTCMQCNRTLALCICPEDVWEARMRQLESSTAIVFDSQAVRAQRLLSKFDIERDRAREAKKRGDSK